ncbi:hypothetical protein SDC9_196683 [bioreactor metagenome]|uniref:Uncharacterized protein n=1 Tax=bioreactor metagenome TaxID=1076179 RepID=A0A645ID60_9ZZZZ
MDSKDCDRKGCGSILDGMSPQCGALFIPIVATILSEGLDSNQIATLGGFVAAVGDAMAYIAAQMDLNEDLCSRSEE